MSPIHSIKFNYIQQHQDVFVYSTAAKNAKKPIGKITKNFALI